MFFLLSTLCNALIVHKNGPSVVEQQRQSSDISEESKFRRARNVLIVTKRIHF